MTDTLRRRDSDADGVSAGGDPLGHKGPERDTISSAHSQAAVAGPPKLHKLAPDSAQSKQPLETTVVSSTSAVPPAIATSRVELAASVMESATTAAPPTPSPSPTPLAEMRNISLYPSLVSDPAIAIISASAIVILLLVGYLVYRYVRNKKAKENALGSGGKSGKWKPPTARPEHDAERDESTTSIVRWNAIDAHPALYSMATLERSSRSQTTEPSEVSIRVLPQRRDGSSLNPNTSAGLRSSILLAAPTPKKQTEPTKLQGGAQRSYILHSLDSVNSQTRPDEELEVDSVLEDRH